MYGEIIQSRHAGSAIIEIININKPKLLIIGANEKEKSALKELIKILDQCKDEMSPEDIQTKIYTVGKENVYKAFQEWILKKRLKYRYQVFGLNSAQVIIK